MSPKTAAARPAPLTSTDYLKQVLTARVYEVAVESDLDPARNLGRRLHNKIFLKREDQQPVFSFKLRGAYNKMAHLTPEQLKAGVICASAGNHAQGVALGGHKLGARAVIVMPTTTPQVKVDAVKQLGGEVVLAGDSYSDVYEHAVKLQAEQGLTFIHPFDDPLVIAGQGTIGMEILRQHQGPLAAVFVAIGGGGLISGVGAYIKAVRPDVKVIGVQMRDSDAMAQSVASGQHVTLADVGLFADGTAVKRVGNETLRVAREVGCGELFSDEVRAALDMVGSEELQQAASHITQEIAEEDEPTVDSFFMIGVHNSMGDWMGFCTSRKEADNYEVFNHEVPIYCYAEDAFWKSFEDWVIASVKSKGQETL